MTVAELLKKEGADVVSFTRFEVGEGIEKQETDFAAEVAAQIAALKRPNRTGFSVSPDRDLCRGLYMTRNQ